MYDRAFCHFLLRTFDKRWSNENIFRLATDILAGLSFLFFAGNDKRDSRERERGILLRSLADRRQPAKRIALSPTIIINRRANFIDGNEDKKAKARWPASF